MAEGRAGGVGSRGVGGGFDGSPGGPSRDGANDDHDPSDRNKYRRKSNARMKLPSEYADFKLADGRTLRDVMGDDFFGSAGQAGGGKWMSKGVRQRLQQGNLPFGGGMYGNLAMRTPTGSEARHPETRAQRAAERRARAEALRAEQQARRDEWRARAEAKRASRPGGNLNFGGWS